MASPEQITWTRDVLEHVYDLAYLQRCLDSSTDCHVPRDAGELQTLLLRLVQQLKPASDVSPNSVAWRIYNALDHRYVRGLTQAEAAAELNISLRQLRREQDRGIEAVATLLYTVERSGRSHESVTPKAPTLVRNPAEIREYLRLDDLMHAVLGLIDPLLGRKNVDVRVMLPQQTPILWINRTLVRQLLITAISVAIHGSTGGLLTISSEVQDAELHVVLSHNGSETPSPDGTQESMVALRQLAQQAGFHVDIAGGQETATRLCLSTTVNARQRVMMIDDNADAIELDQRYLAQTQFELVATTRAEDALMQAQVLQPSCILLDVMMPGRDGWEVLTLLKSHPATLHIPVVVCSVLRNPDLAYALGAAAVLPRPHSASQLRELLEAVIGLPPAPRAA